MPTPTSMKDFKVLAALGKGSYGSVMKVERISDGFTYAIKEVNIRRLSPREREDALNEIRILASIRHGNIVRYCDAFTEKDNLYIVMEFAEGGDIGRQIEKFKKANKYIKEDTIWSYTIQICRALNDLHSRSILHRDLKPKNVFLTGKNHVRLGDLGCAKLIKTGLARTQIGTPYYMSPEIWASKPYDHKSDMWALGCLLYELAMLSPPFLANDMNGLAQKVKTTSAARISKHYSDDLANLVAALLHKDPKMRPDAKAVLSMPCVMAKLALVPEDEDGPWAGDDMRSAMLATIRVPHMFGYGGKPALNLPAPAYPVLKRADSMGESDGDRTPRVSTPPKSVPTAGSGLPPKPTTRAGFGAVTSPPNFGKYASKDVEDKENRALGIAEKLARVPSAGILASNPVGAPVVKPLVSVPSSRNLAPAPLPSSRAAVAPMPSGPSQPMQPVRPAPRIASDPAARPGGGIVPSAAVRKYLAAGAPVAAAPVVASRPSAGPVVPSVPPKSAALPSRPSLPSAVLAPKYVYPSAAAYGVPMRPSVAVRGF